MLDPSTVDLLHTGCALLVGVGMSDGTPYAARAWGLDLLDDASRGRLLVDADDASLLALLTPGAPIAVTGADVATLTSAQVKGRVLGVEPAAPTDPDRVQRYVEDFVDAIMRTEGTPRHLVERLVPVEVVVCTFVVEEEFDQTPGPTAGEALGGAR